MLVSMIRLSQSKQISWLFLLAMLAACAPTVSQREQTIPVTLAPTGAKVVVYGWDGSVLAGPVTSPGKIVLSRPSYIRPALIVVSKTGYCPAYVIPKSDLSEVDTVESLRAGYVDLAAQAGSGNVDREQGGAFLMDTTPFRSLSLKELGKCD